MVSVGAELPREILPHMRQGYQQLKIILGHVKFCCITWGTESKRQVNSSIAFYLTVALAFSNITTNQLQILANVKNVNYFYTLLNPCLFTSCFTLLYLKPVFSKRLKHGWRQKYFQGIVVNLSQCLPAPQWIVLCSSALGQSIHTYCLVYTHHIY